MNAYCRSIAGLFYPPKIDLSEQVMDQSWPLFNKAIPQSGNFASWGAHSWSAAERNYATVIETLECDPSHGYATEAQQIECLTSADWVAVVEAGNLANPCRDGCPWAPVIDGIELTDFPTALVASGHHAMDKPVIMSHTEDDGATYTYMSKTGPDLNPAAPPPPPNPYTGQPTPRASVTQGDLEAYWSGVFSDAALPDLRRLYDSTTTEYQDMAAASEFTISAQEFAGFKAETDFNTICTGRWASEGLSRVVPVYEMQFAFGYDSRTMTEANPRIAISHGAEVDFIFSKPNQPIGPDWSRSWELTPGELAEAVRLSDIMVGYWVNFATTGDPNGVTDLGVALPRWPQTTGSYDGNGDGISDSDVVLRVAGADPGDITVLDMYHGDACQWWHEHWQPFDKETCSSLCFGGCIPCDGHRLDFSSQGEPPYGAC